MDPRRTLTPIIEENMSGSKSFSVGSLSFESKLVSSEKILAAVDLTTAEEKPLVSAETEPIDSKYKVSDYYCCPKLSKNKKPQSKENDDKKSYSSLLERSFVFRKAESLDRAVTADEKRLIALYRQQLKHPAVEEFAKLSTTSSSTISPSFSSSCPSSSKSSLASTSTPEPGVHKGTPDYPVLSLLEAEEEYREGIESLVGEAETTEKKEILEESIALVTAQRYLRLHRIFEFFQFLIAHLLSALPENPINFLLELLDRCIIYRAGMAQAPLLYDRKHLDALFNMMDRMRTGYIDLQQYTAAMKTLGLCIVKENLQTNPNTQITKEIFIEDALEALLSTLSDILRRKYMKNDKLHITTPPPTPYFIQQSSRSKTSLQNTKSSITRR